MNGRFRKFAMLIPLLPVLAQALPKDVRGSSDHPLFPGRIPGYIISSYKSLGFASYALRMRPPKTLEGKFTLISYLADANSPAGPLEIRRNYEEAIHDAGGELVYSDDNVSIMKAMRDGVEVWVELHAGLKDTGKNYRLLIVEIVPIQQVITADALGAALDRDGFIALDFHYEKSKADIPPWSRRIIDELAKMLKERPALRIGVEGHTDARGDPAINMALSRLRAETIVNALRAAGIDGSRLLPTGFGPTMPIADNGSESGRLKNRRIEIVKK